MEESYRKLLEDLIRGRHDMQLETAIVEAHKVVAAKLKFEQAMDRAIADINNRRIVDNF